MGINHLCFLVLLSAVNKKIGQASFLIFLANSYILYCKGF